MMEEVRKDPMAGGFSNIFTKLLEIGWFFVILNY
jgi:hypothetical protein